MVRLGVPWHFKAHERLTFMLFQESPMHDADGPDQSATIFWMPAAPAAENTSPKPQLNSMPELVSEVSTTWF